MEFLANPDLKNVAALATAATKVLVVDGANNTVKTNTPAQIVAGLDGDKGDITVSASGATWTIDNDVVTYAKMQNVSATSRVLGRKTANSGDTEECTLSEVLDFVGSAAQGDILYRNATTWTRLGAGTSGQYLKTQGSGANPVWASVTGSGNQSFQATFLAATSDATNGCLDNYIQINSDQNEWGWPYCGGSGQSQADSLLGVSTVFVPFNPTTYRFNCQVSTAPTYSFSPTGGDFGIKFQYSTNNSTGWTDIATVGFRTKARGDFLNVTGSLSISGSPAQIYVRAVKSYTLTGGGPSVEYGIVGVRMLVANFYT